MGYRRPYRLHHSSHLDSFTKGVIGLSVYRHTSDGRTGRRPSTRPLSRQEGGGGERVWRRGDRGPPIQNHRWVLPSRPFLLHETCLPRPDPGSRRCGRRQCNATKRVSGRCDLEGRHPPPLRSFLGLEPSLTVSRHPSPCDPGEGPRNRWRGPVRYLGESRSGTGCRDSLPPTPTRHETPVPGQPNPRTRHYYAVVYDPRNFVLPKRVTRSPVSRL